MTKWYSHFLSFEFILPSFVFRGFAFLHNNSHRDILIIFGRNVNQVQEVCCIQEWQLSLLKICIWIVYLCQSSWQSFTRTYYWEDQSLDHFFIFPYWVFRVLLVLALTPLGLEIFWYSMVRFWIKSKRHFTCRNDSSLTL